MHFCQASLCDVTNCTATRCQPVQLAVGFTPQCKIQCCPTQHHSFLELEEAVNGGLNEQVSVGSNAVENVCVKMMQLLESLDPKITAVWCKMKFKKNISCASSMQMLAQ